MTLTDRRPQTQSVHKRTRGVSGGVDSAVIAPVKTADIMCLSLSDDPEMPMLARYDAEKLCRQLSIDFFPMMFAPCSRDCHRFLLLMPVSRLYANPVLSVTVF